MRSLIRLLTPILFAVVVLTTITAIAATNTIPSTRIDNDFISFNINQIKPSACAGINLTSLVTGSGVITGTPGNDLILGSSLADTISADGGDNCILGGAGDDIITGGLGNDVCIGGPGNDIFLTCEIQIQ